MTHLQSYLSWELFQRHAPMYERDVYWLVAEPYPMWPKSPCRCCDLQSNCGASESARHLCSLADLMDTNNNHYFVRGKEDGNI